jgi:hypothetical protein
MPGSQVAPVPGSVRDRELRASRSQGRALRFGERCGEGIGVGHRVVGLDPGNGGPCRDSRRGRICVLEIAKHCPRVEDDRQLRWWCPWSRCRGGVRCADRAGPAGRRCGAAHGSRYEEAGAWKRNGARSPEDDIARKTGTGTTRARRKLSTSKRLRSQPKTDEAVRRGRVSTDQADEVSEGAGVAPEAEDDLLDTARNRPLHDLRRRAAEERAKADRDGVEPGTGRGRRGGEIAGVGPVAVSAVRRLLSDAFLTLVFEKGEDVRNVPHFGRQVTARQRTALEARGARAAAAGDGPTTASDRRADRSHPGRLTGRTRASAACRRAHSGLRRAGACQVGGGYSKVATSVPAASSSTTRPDSSSRRSGKQVSVAGSSNSGTDPAEHRRRPSQHPWEHSDR